MNYLKIGGIAITCSLIIGFSLIVVQSNKQDSIERMKREEITLEKNKISAKTAEEESRKIDLDFCLSGANEKYWNYVKLNGTEVAGKPGTYNALQYVWDNAQKLKDKAEDVCFKRYQ